jgi:transposase, IS6 family
VGKGGSGLRSRRGERSGYVGPFDHPKREQKTAESPLQRRVARRVRWRGCENRRFVRGILRRVPIQFKKGWTYLYRAVDSEGNTLEFLLSSTRDAEAAKRFFLKALPSPAGSAPGAPPFEEQVAEPTAMANPVTPTPRVINVEKNAAYPKAMAELKAAGQLPESVELRQVKYLNNMVEQDHRFIKRLVKPGMGFFSFETAWRTLQGYEVRHMLRKGQMRGVEKGDILGQVAFISALFGMAA